MMTATNEPVTVGGWYENTDASVSEYQWSEGQLQKRRTVASWTEVPDRDAELAAGWKAEQAEWKARQLAAEAFGEQHGISPYDAELVLTALRLGADDLAYVAQHPEHTSALDIKGTSDRIAGQSGWLVWFAPNETAIMISNGDAAHGEGWRRTRRGRGRLASLEAARAWAEDDGVSR